MSDELVVLLSGEEVGRVRQTGGRASLRYDDRWRENEAAYPLSLSMPLAAADHGPGVVEPFLWGLLPDNEQVLDRWARRFQVSARNPFALLANVGEDCAGAVQFVRPERLDEVLSGSADNVEWLNEDEIEARLRLLRADHAAWRLPSDAGQFSLAGAQPKTALLLDGGRWGVPSGRLPTTHILKPPTGGFAGHAENEHVCMKLARALGLPAAESDVVRFGSEIAVAIQRYDRVRDGNDLIRVHQEDACQALAVPPIRKYENEGGPGVRGLVELLRTHSTERALDIGTFIDAVGFNWLIGGTDAHAKNYSLLLSGGPQVRLAPLYDVASILPYDGIDMRRAKSAMKIGGEYRLADIRPRHWLRLAAEARVDGEQLLQRLVEMTERLPDAVNDIRDATESAGLDQPVVERLEARLIERARACRKNLAARNAEA